MSRLWFIAILAALTLLLVGCGGSQEDRLVGTYSIKQELSKKGEVLNNKTASKGQQQEMSQAQVSLVLNKDKSASLSIAGMPGSPATTIPGIWELKDQVVMVSLQQGQSGKYGIPMALMPSEDGKTLSTGSGQFGSLTLVKD